MRFPGWVLALVAAIFNSSLFAQAQSERDLASLTLEQLLEVEVTSVSRRAERAAQASAAVGVITAEDIRRYGAATLPEILRLAVGLQVAQDDGSGYAITARGFNSTTANKLLVLIDGRTVYTPLFSGVFWDVQDVLLSDVERIEIVRGPGATLWGANAVNGVINIITKNSRETQGVIATAGSGNELFGFGEARFGGDIGDRTFYRAYSKYTYQDGLGLAGGGSARDPVRFGQAGFRSDWEDAEAQDSVLLSGDIYSGLAGELIRPDTKLAGGNLLARWSRAIPDGSNIQLQTYYDRTHRNIPAFYREVRDTFDVDFQHEMPVGDRHFVLWGGGFRATSDRTRGSAELSFRPASRKSPLYNVFLQDDIQFLNRRLSLTLGTQIEHNDYTGLEVQPSTRLAWRPSETQTLWASVGRAVRSPTRLDVDLDLHSGPITLVGNSDFKSESVLAYEVGYKTQPVAEVSFDIATFYNVYGDLRSLEPQPQTNTTILIANKLNARTYGAEITADYQVTSSWRLRAGYVYLGKRFSLDPESRDPGLGAAEGNDPQNRFLLRSYLDLPRDFEFDTALRFMGELPSPVVPRYLELDARFGWLYGREFDFSIVGRNLFDSQHPEFGVGGPTRQEVQRSAFGRVTWRF